MIKAIRTLNELPPEFRERVWKEIGQAHQGQDLFILHTFQTLEDAADYLKLYGNELSHELLETCFYGRFNAMEQGIIIKLMKANADERAAIHSHVRAQLLRTARAVKLAIENAHKKAGDDVPLWNRVKEGIHAYKATRTI